MNSPRAARWGMIIFILGLILLLMVFLLAFGMFHSTARLLAASENLPPTELPPLSQQLSVGALRLGFLLIMGYVSSLIAGKGIALYGACREAHRE